MEGEGGEGGVEGEGRRGVGGRWSGKGEGEGGEGGVKGGGREDREWWRGMEE